MDKESNKPEKEKDAKQAEGEKEQQKKAEEKKPEEKDEQEKKEPGPKKKKKINRLTLKELEKEIQEVQEKMGGLSSAYARQLLKRKEQY